MTAISTCFTIATPTPTQQSPGGYTSTKLLRCSQPCISPAACVMPLLHPLLHHHALLLLLFKQSR
jgi:hypothetical protein